MCLIVVEARKFNIVEAIKTLTMQNNKVKERKNARKGKKERKEMHTCLEEGRKGWKKLTIIGFFIVLYGRYGRQ